MKKAIGILLAMLMALPIAAFADIEVGSRVTEYEDGDAPIAGHNGYIDVSSQNINEVAVCTTKDKKHGFVVASVKSRDSIGVAIAKARELFAGMQGAGGYDHFGCTRIKF